MNSSPPQLAEDSDSVAVRRPMSQEVYNTLLTRFLSNDLEPGSRITIDALARELAVSPTPIREALDRLEMNGLVVRQLNAGYRIAPKMTRRQFEDLVEMRVALEPITAKRAAERMKPLGLKQLQEIADRMSENDGQEGGDSYAVFAQFDAEFHDAIAAGGENELIRHALARLGIHVRLFRLLYRARIRTDALAEHQAVVDAIRSGDPEGAAYQMRRHILRSAERFRESFEA